jgi:hypothetical protein
MHATLSSLISLCAFSFPPFLSRSQISVKRRMCHNLLLSFSHLISYTLTHTTQNHDHAPALGDAMLFIFQLISHHGWPHRGLVSPHSAGVRATVTVAATAPFVACLLQGPIFMLLRTCSLHCKVVTPAIRTMQLPLLKRGIACLIFLSFSVHPCTQLPIEIQKPNVRFPYSGCVYM